jgi:hypothetical protein
MAGWRWIARVVIAGIVAGGGAAFADGRPPVVGAVLPEIVLKAPANPEERAYLGLPSEAGEFTLSEVAAEVVVIEVFNMY